MREEKSEEPIPLEPARPMVREWARDELLVEGECEARSCPGCRARLRADAGAFGLVLPCPRCGVRSRILAAEGPFAALALDAPPVHRPAPPIELVPVVSTMSALPPAAPVVPFRRMDPIDERSPMVTAVARLQWIGGAFLLAVVIQQLGVHWKREFVSESEEFTTFLTAGGRAVLGVLCFVAAGGIDARKTAGWVLGLALSLAILAGSGWLLYERTIDQTGIRARFDFGVLLELPAILIAVVTATVLATPRYAAEFFPESRNQRGTIEVPTS
jgi:hypothetical protein